MQNIFAYRYSVPKALSSKLHPVLIAFESTIYMGGGIAHNRYFDVTVNVYFDEER